MASVFFTSDSHFGHKNIVKATSDWSDASKCRDFASVEEHDEYLLKQINDRVGRNDTLYHLGDFGFGFGLADKLPELRKRIRCARIVLILGNHDHLFDSHSKHREKLLPLFHRVEKLFYGKVGGHRFVLCHYAMRTWPWQHHGVIHLYGHSHGNLPDDPDALSLDVGVDTCLFGHERYTPYSLEEILAIMERKRFVPVDHHR